MRSWHLKNLFSESRLLRKVSAWCPQLFRELAVAPVPRYEIPVVGFGAVKICPLHKEPLREIVRNVAGG